jgi:hypothetical protein
MHVQILWVICMVVGKTGWFGYSDIKNVQNSSSPSRLASPVGDRPVDARGLDGVVEPREERAGAAHVRDDVGALALVRGDDADLVGGGPALEEGRHHLLHHRGLRAVQVRGAGGAAPNILRE